jgi:hypothetical protein
VVSSASHSRCHSTIAEEGLERRRRLESVASLLAVLIELALSVKSLLTACSEVAIGCLNCALSVQILNLTITAEMKTDHTKLMTETA